MRNLKFALRDCERFEGSPSNLQPCILSYLTSAQPNHLSHLQKRDVLDVIKLGYSFVLIEQYYEKKEKRSLSNKNTITNNKYLRLKYIYLHMYRKVKQNWKFLFLRKSEMMKS